MIDESEEFWKNFKGRDPLNKESKCFNNKKYEKNSLINLNGRLPDFINLILEDDYLNEKSKKDFDLINFLDKSPEGLKYRKKTVGKFLFWLNKKFIGVINNSDDTLLYGKRGDNKFLVQIGTHTEKSYSKIIHGKFLDVFYVNLKLTNKRNPTNANEVFNSRMIIDTGCTLTDLPNDDY